jgi:hypothetical protein
LQYCRLIELERFSLRRTWKHKQEKQTKSDVSTKQKMEVWGKNTRVQAKIRQRITHTITDYTIILAIVIVQFIHRSTEGWYQLHTTSFSFSCSRFYAVTCCFEGTSITQLTPRLALDVALAFGHRCCLTSSFVIALSYLLHLGRWMS